MPVVLSTSRRLISLSFMMFTLVCSGTSVTRPTPSEAGGLGPLKSSPVPEPSRGTGQSTGVLPLGTSVPWRVGTGFSDVVTPRRLLAVGRAVARAIECGESESTFQRHITGVAHDTRYDVWECGARSWCQGAVQEIELVPSEGSRASTKLDPGGRPRTGQSEEALWFRCRFRSGGTASATRVPSEGSRKSSGGFPPPATKVPSEGNEGRVRCESRRFDCEGCA